MKGVCGSLINIIRRRRNHHKKSSNAKGPFSRGRIHASPILSSVFAFVEACPTVPCFGMWAHGGVSSGFLLLLPGSTCRPGNFVLVSLGDTQQGQPVDSGGPLLPRPAFLQSPRGAGSCTRLEDTQPVMKPRAGGRERLSDLHTQFLPEGHWRDSRGRVTLLLVAGSYPRT